MSQHAGIALPNSIDLSAHFPAFFSRKAFGDEQVASSLIAAGLVTFASSTPTEVTQVVHVTLDTLLARVLETRGHALRDLSVDIELKIGGQIVRFSESNLDTRLIHGKERDYLRKNIKKAMRPHVESLLMGYSFKNKSNYINILLNRVVTVATNALTDERIDPLNVTNIECKCSRA